MDGGEIGLLIALGIIIASPAVLWAGFKVHERIDLRRLAVQLRTPEIGGIPLPAVDDPRWQEIGGGASLGTPHAGFMVTWCFGRISFQGQELGTWQGYADAVRAPLQREATRKLADRALAAIVDEPSTETTKKEGQSHE